MVFIVQRDRRISVRCEHGNTGDGRRPSRRAERPPFDHPLHSEFRNEGNRAP